MKKCFRILGGVALLLAFGYAAEIPNTMKKETMMMVETRKDVPMMAEEPMVVEGSHKESVTVDQPSVEEAVEDQPMTADKSLTEEPSRQESVMAQPIIEAAIDETLPAGQETMNIEDQVESARGFGEVTAADVVKKIYAECLRIGSFACVKPKVLAFLSTASKKDRIMLTRDLSIEKTGKYYAGESAFHQWNAASPNDAADMLERIDDFLNSHELKLRVPKEIVSGELLPLVPKLLLENVPTEFRVPLTDTRVEVQERGFMKKIVMPFLLGLKFKATALVPLALALIALKTWKALTLGLLSLVLSGALLLFKFSRPKVATYEVVHVPHATSSVIEHSAPASYDHHGYGREFDAQSLAYRGYRTL